MGALLFRFPQDTEINRGRKALYILLWGFFNCDKLIMQLSSWWFVVITLFLCMFVIMEILKGMLWFVQNSDNCKSVLKDPHLCLILSICLKEKGGGKKQPKHPSLPGTDLSPAGVCLVEASVVLLWGLVRMGRRRHFSIVCFVPTFVSIFKSSQSSLLLGSSLLGYIQLPRTHPAVSDEIYSLFSSPTWMKTEDRNNTCLGRKQKDEIVRGLFLLRYRCKRGE